jgi:hypothetical protein
MSNGLTLPYVSPLFSGTQVAFTINASSNTAIEGICHDGPGVAGSSQAGNATVGVGQSGNGVVGVSSSATSNAVLGENLGGGYGIQGWTNSNYQPGPSGVAGVWGNNLGSGTGVKGTSTGGDAVLGYSSSNAHAGVSAVNDSGGFGVWARGTPAGHFEGNVEITGISTSQAGVVGESQQPNGPGVLGENRAEGGRGVVGNGFTATGIGVLGQNGQGDAIFGNSGSGRGVVGHSTNQAGVVGDSDHFDGVFGATRNPNAAAVSGHSLNPDGSVNRNGLAGFFDGNVSVTGDIFLQNADCAEDFDIAVLEGVEPGSVMVIGHDGTLRQSELAYDKRVAGVVSGGGDYKPGIVLDRREPTRNRKSIALLGKVYCKADASRAPIEVGDLLTTSPTPGHAMKATDPVRAFGAVIGKALRPVRDGQGLIPILVALQ